MIEVVNPFDSTGFTGKKKADQTGRRNFFGSGGWSPWLQFCNCLIFCIFQLLNNLQLKILLHNVGDLWSSFFTDDIKR